MKGIITKVYLGCIVVCLIAVWYICSQFRLDITQRQNTDGYEVITDYEYYEYADSSAPCGVREEYFFDIPQIDGSYRNLLFYSLHQNVNVYVNGERVYRMKAFTGNEFGRSAGVEWNSVAFADGEADGRVRVVLYPAYKSVRKVRTIFYYGSKYSIAFHVIRNQVPVLLLSLIGIVTGVIFTIYMLYNYKNSENEKSLVMLGCFAILISVWKITDNPAMYLMFPQVQGLYLVPYLALHLAPVAFVMFVRELHNSKDKFIWNVPIIFNMAVFVLNLSLQFTNIADMRQTLFLLHIALIVDAVTVFGMTVYEFVTAGLDAKLKRNTIFLSLCLLGMFFDMVVYYVSKGEGNTVIGMLGFILYIFALGAFSIKDARALMDIGLQATIYEKKAYHDQLTGLYNRMAFADYVGKESFNAEKCIIAVFDLNNLKKCNDTLGHEKGDIYIKECAAVIQETFGDIGKCYRMGGDEFTVLLERVPLDTCKKRMETLPDTVKKHNKLYPDIEMGIAGGYQMYDKRIDHDLNDTSRRADKMMYQRKFTMKQKM